MGNELPELDHQEPCIGENCEDFLWNTMPFLFMCEEEQSTPSQTAEMNSGVANTKNERHALTLKNTLGPETVQDSVGSRTNSHATLLPDERGDTAGQSSKDSAKSTTPSEKAERGTSQKFSSPWRVLNEDSAAPTANGAFQSSNMNRRNVYVSGLPPHFRSNDFRTLCQQYGCVEASKLCIDGSTTPTKGYGFALFFTGESASACIAGLNGCLLSGRRLQSHYAASTATPQFLSDSGALSCSSPSLPALDCFSGPHVTVPPSPYAPYSLPVPQNAFPLTGGNTLLPFYGTVPPGVVISQPSVLPNMAPVFTMPSPFVGMPPSVYLQTAAPTTPNLVMWQPPSYVEMKLFPPPAYGASVMRSFLQ